MLSETIKLPIGREIFQTLLRKRWGWSWIYLFIAGGYPFEEEGIQGILELALEVCWIKKDTEYWVHYAIFCQTGQQIRSGSIVKVNIKHSIDERIICIPLSAARGSFYWVKII